MLRFSSMHHLLQCDFCATVPLDSKLHVLIHKDAEILMSVHLTNPFAKLFSTLQTENSDDSMQTPASTDVAKSAHSNELCAHRVLPTMWPATRNAQSLKRVVGTHQQLLSHDICACFNTSHIYRQPVGKGQVANICATAPFPQHDKHPRFTAVSQIHQSTKRGSTNNGYLNASRGARAGAVGQRKPEGSGFDSRQCNWNFSLT